MTFKTVFTWAIGGGFALYVIFLSLLFTRLGVNRQIWEVTIKQWLATIIFPSACFASLVVVMVLDQSSGTIEFSGLGFQFKGAAAPLVLWAMLIIVMAISLRLLWLPVNTPYDSLKPDPINEGKTNMPKYLIEREIPGAGNLSSQELQRISQTSCSVLQKMGPQIQWLQSYVTGDKVYCVYIAPNEEMIREHARQGGFPANRVSEIKSVIDPTTAEVKSQSAGS